jgi:hypothetical protein
MGEIMTNVVWTPFCTDCDKELPDSAEALKNHPCPNKSWIPYCMDCDERLPDNESELENHDCPYKDLVQYRQ